MSIVLTYIVALLAGALSLWALWFVIRNRPVILRQLWGAAVVEVALVIQLVLSAVMMASSNKEFDPVNMWGYLIVVLLILPIAAFWAFAERTRWSSVVLMVASWTVIFLELRLLQIWGN